MTWQHYEKQMQIFSKVGILILIYNVYLVVMNLRRGKLIGGSELYRFLTFDIQPCRELSQIACWVAQPSD